MKINSGILVQLKTMIYCKNSNSNWKHYEKTKKWKAICNLNILMKRVIIVRKKIMDVSFHSIHGWGFVSFGIRYLYVFRVRSRVLFSDWSISKMNITNLALDQSERSTESWRSVILIFDLRLRGGCTRTFQGQLRKVCYCFLVITVFMKVFK